MDAKLPFSESNSNKRRSKAIPIAIVTTAVSAGGAAAALIARRNNAKHPSADDELASHISDMLLLNSFVLGEIDNHLHDDAMRMSHDERGLEEDVRRTLMLHNEGLQRELESLGGRVPSKTKAAAGAASGVVAAMGERMLYKGLQGHPVSRMVRDTYTMLSAIAVSYTMLHATARAMHRDSLADLAGRQLTETSEFIVRYSQHIPRTVINELSGLHSDVDRSVTDRAVNESQEAWAKAGGQ